MFQLSCKSTNQIHPVFSDTLTTYLKSGSIVCVCVCLFFTALVFHTMARSSSLPCHNNLTLLLIFPFPFFFPQCFSPAMFSVGWNAKTSLWSFQGFVPAVCLVYYHIFFRLWLSIPLVPKFLNLNRNYFI